MLHDPIVTVTPTIQDGIVVRWYDNPNAAVYGHELVSASRNGVLVHAYLNEVPADILDRAREAYEILRDGKPPETVYAMATHRSRLLSGDLEPIVREEAPDVA